MNGERGIYNTLPAVNEGFITLAFFPSTNPIKARLFEKVARSRLLAGDPNSSLPCFNASSVGLARGSTEMTRNLSFCNLKTAFFRFEALTIRLVI